MLLRRKREADGLAGRRDTLDDESALKLLDEIIEPNT